ncbi:MAG TPA: tyrosine-type recombinase/integrase [Spirochaetales bacterium]|nr:tyrosine-type recombinase/integrase [Spirochaetales bacterium]
MSDPVEDRSLYETYIRYLSHVRLVSPATVRGYSQDIEYFLRWKNESQMEGFDLKPAQIRSYLGQLFHQGLAPSSINRNLAALRGFFKFLLDQGKINQDPLEGLGGLKVSKTLPAILFEEEVARFLDVEPDSFLEIRNNALFEVLYSTGCRVGEIVSLQRNQWSKEVTRFRIVGKGRKERLVFLGEEAQKALLRYIPLRDERVARYRKERESALFVNALGKRLTARGVAYVLEKRLEKLGMQKPASPHTFRHSFATHVLNRGADIRIVQELLGHERLSTTQVYTHIGIDALKDLYIHTHPHGLRKS